MTLYERLRRVEHRAAGAWLLVVAAAHTDAGVAFPLFMALAVAMLVLGGWWLARVGLSLAFARDVKESWRSRLWVPAALLIEVLLASSDLPLMARLWLSEPRGGFVHASLWIMVALVSKLVDVAVAAPTPCV